MRRLESAEGRRGLILLVVPRPNPTLPYPAARNGRQGCARAVRPRVGMGQPQAPRLGIENDRRKPRYARPCVTNLNRAPNSPTQRAPAPAGNVDQMLGSISCSRGSVTMILIAPTNWRHSGGSHDRCDTKQRQRQDDHTEHRVHSDLLSFSDGPDSASTRRRASHPAPVAGRGEARREAPRTMPSSTTWHDWPHHTR